MRSYEEKTMERIKDQFKDKYGVVDFGINASGGFLITYSNKKQRVVDKYMVIDMLNEKYS